jgi:hypothetical protein
MVSYPHPHPPSPFIGIFLDNFYSSPTLFEYLHHHETGACETIRKNRVGLPKFKARVEPEEQVFFYHTEKLLALQWYRHFMNQL